MKIKARILSVLLVLAACIGIIPASASVTADEDVYSGAPAVYVRDGGTGDGSSPERAMADLREAFSLLSETGGYAVICGDLTISANFLFY